ncbi:MAG: hypothetical protein EAY75_18235, partial [Bacteroidetes bacterium]
MKPKVSRHSRYNFTARFLTQKAGFFVQQSLALRLPAAAPQRLSANFPPPTMGPTGAYQEFIFSIYT